MNPSSILLLFLLGTTAISAIIINGGGGGGRRRKKSRYDGSSSSWDSDSDEHHHHHHPRPPRGPRRTTTPRIPGCTADWMTFDRPQGKWCVKVFYGPGTQANAVQQCQAQQAKLTGVQDNNEREQMAAAGRTVVNLNGGGEADIWLGASRRSNCPYKSSCGAMDTFEWTDGSATGIAGFKWGNTEPNGIIYPNWHNSNNWGQQNCLVQLINGSGDRTKFGYWHGEMDDQHCQNTFRMYACGRSAA